MGDTTVTEYLTPQVTGYVADPDLWRDWQNYMREHGKVYVRRNGTSFEFRFQHDPPHHKPLSLREAANILAGTHDDVDHIGRDLSRFRRFWQPIIQNASEIVPPDKPIITSLVMDVNQIENLAPGLYHLNPEWHLDIKLEKLGRFRDMSSELFLPRGLMTNRPSPRFAALTYREQQEFHEQHLEITNGQLRAYRIKNQAALADAIETRHASVGFRPGANIFFRGLGIFIAVFLPKLGRKLSATETVSCY